MSPLTLELLLWIYTRPNIDEFQGYASPAVRSALEWLFINGIVDCIDLPALTDKGKAWLTMIQKTPFPEQCWADPRTKERVE